MSDHERAILGVLIREKPDLYDSLGLAEADFAEPAHRAVWRAIGAVIDAGLRPDLVTVGERCNGQAAIVASLTSLGLAANVEYHTAEIKRASLSRRVTAAIPRLQDAAAQGPEAFGDALEAVASELSGEELTPPRELWRVLVDTTGILENRANTPGGMIGVSCGFRSVDYWTKGFQPGDLVIVAARTSVGKTALALSMARRMRVPIGFMSIEMTAEQIGERLLAMEARKSTLGVHIDDMLSLVEAGERMQHKRVWIDDAPTMTLAKLRGRARWMRRRGIECLFVDYLTLIKPEEGDETHRSERVGKLAKGLKQLARELGIPIVALSQINRIGEGQMPGLENLRQSGEIEEDADLVLLLHRKRDEKDTLLRVAKNRRGPVGDVELHYESEYTLFTEVEHENHARNGG